MRRVYARLATAMTLIACAHAADAPVPGALDVTGTEPFWSVQIRANGLTLSTPDKGVLHFQAVKRTTDKNGITTWTGTAADKSAMTVVVWGKPCSDGMSDRAYPFSAAMHTSAVVELGNDEVQGCAAPPGSFKAAP